MSKKIKFNNSLYDINDMSEQARGNLALLEFTTRRINELQKMLDQLKVSRKQCFQTIQKEIISAKAGIVLE